MHWCPTGLGTDPRKFNSKQDVLNEERHLVRIENPSRGIEYPTQIETNPRVAKVYQPSSIDLGYRGWRHR